MVNALDSGASGPGSYPDREHCVVFMGKTLLSRCLAPPRYIKGCDGLAFHPGGSRNKTKTGISSGPMSHPGLQN